jgi:NAD(P)-dependent dehydrogenase (short-subunit alcohol dehydrogenase family)
VRSLEKDATIKTVAEKEKLPIKVIQLDVTDNQSVNNAIQTIVSEAAGRIDVLVNNAGYGLVGAFEDLSMEEIKAQYETNVFGLIRVTQTVLPIMRELQSGIIVNLSSGAGIFGYPGGSAYVSTKFAVEGLTESIAYELEPFWDKSCVDRTWIYQNELCKCNGHCQESTRTKITIFANDAKNSSKFKRNGKEWVSC